jgi:hypothetical protein
MAVKSRQAFPVLSERSISVIPGNHQVAVSIEPKNSKLEKAFRNTSPY